MELAGSPWGPVWSYSQNIQHVYLTGYSKLTLSVYDCVTAWLFVSPLIPPLID